MCYTHKYFQERRQLLRFWVDREREEEAETEDDANEFSILWHV